MNIVVAVDSFKGSCSAEQACAAITKGLTQYNSALNVIQIPIADGGEGLLQILKNSTQLKQQQHHEIVVTGPYGQKVTASYITISNHKAILEMAQSCGLELTPISQRNVLNATSYGLGQMLKHALEKGHRHIVIGLGGSATNDGGIGFAQALGARFFDVNDNLIPEPASGKDLIRVHRVDVSALHPRLHEVVIEASCDVNNPLLGPTGATWIYGMQKGADRSALEQLELGMINFNQVMTSTCNYNVDTIEGSGAAGGMGAALHWFANGSLRPGIELVLELLDARQSIQNADLIITGEGKLDKQSSFGKAPAGIAKLASEYNKPVVALCGSLGEGAEILYQHNINAMWSICPRPITLEAPMAEAENLLTHCTESLIRTLDIGQKIAQSYQR